MPPCHTCPPITHIPATHAPLPCMPPATHAPPCHACPPPAMHTPLPHTPPSPLPDRILDTCLWKYYLAATSLRAVKMSCMKKKNHVTFISSLHNTLFAWAQRSLSMVQKLYHSEKLQVMNMDGWHMYFKKLLWIRSVRNMNFMLNDLLQFTPFMHSSN